MTTAGLTDMDEPELHYLSAEAARALVSRGLGDADLQVSPPALLCINSFLDFFLYLVLEAADRLVMCNVQAVTLTIVPERLSREIHRVAAAELYASVGPPDPVKPDAALQLNSPQQLDRVFYHLRVLCMLYSALNPLGDTADCDCSVPEGVAALTSEEQALVGQNMIVYLTNTLEFVAEHLLLLGAYSVRYRNRDGATLTLSDLDYAIFRDEALSELWTVFKESVTLDLEQNPTDNEDTRSHESPLPKKALLVDDTPLLAPLQMSTGSKGVRAGRLPPINESAADSEKRDDDDVVDGAFDSGIEDFALDEPAATKGQHDEDSASEYCDADPFATPADGMSVSSPKADDSGVSTSITSPTGQSAWRPEAEQEGGLLANSRLAKEDLVAGSSSPTQEDVDTSETSGSRHGRLIHGSPVQRLSNRLSSHEVARILGIPDAEFDHRSLSTDFRRSASGLSGYKHGILIHERRNTIDAEVGQALKQLSAERSVSFAGSGSSTRTWDFETAKGQANTVLERMRERRKQYRQVQHLRPRQARVASASGTSDLADFIRNTSPASDHDSQRDSSAFVPRDELPEDQNNTNDLAQFLRTTGPGGKRKHQRKTGRKQERGSSARGDRGIVPSPLLRLFSRGRASPSSSTASSQGRSEKQKQCGPEAAAGDPDVASLPEIDSMDFADLDSALQSFEAPAAGERPRLVPRDAKMRPSAKADDASGESLADFLRS